MAVYDRDSNAILAEPLKSKISSEHFQAITKVNNFLNQKGIKPKTHAMDNKYSDLVKNTLIMLKYRITPRPITCASNKGS